MKNKNSIFIFIILSIIFSLGKIYFIKDFKVERDILVVKNDAVSLPTSDVKKIETFLKSKNTQNISWETLTDFRLKLETSINKENAKNVFEVANKNLPDLIKCLRKDYCGMDPATIEKPYFDKDRTPAHLIAARTLSAMLLSIKLNPELKKDVDWNLIREISGLSGNELRAASMDLLINYDVNNNGKDSLYKVAESYSGQAKANFYTQMAADLATNERAIFVSTVEKSLEKDDPNTVISIVESLKKYKLTSTEMVGVSKVLCRFKNDEAQGHNWLMIKSLMNKLDKNFEQICL